jgi:hypothetical protein
MSVDQSSQHSELKFTIRGGCPSTRVLEAWNESFPVRVTGDEDAETRYHPPTGLLILAREGTIVTTKRAAHEDWYSPHVSECAGCEFQYDPMSQGLVCPYCEYDNTPTADRGDE